MAYTRSPEIRARQSAIMKARHADPQWRQRWAAGLQESIDNRQLTYRQIKFAGLLAQGKNPYRAYREAGYVPDRAECYRALENPRIGRAVNDIRRRAMKRSDIDLDKLLTWSNEVREKAVETKQLSAAQGTIALMAKLCGLLTEKTQLSTVPVEAMSKEQIEQVVNGMPPDEAETMKALLFGVIPKPTNTAPDSVN